MLAGVLSTVPPMSKLHPSASIPMAAKVLDFLPTLTLEQRMVVMRMELHDAGDSINQRQRPALWKERLGTGRRRPKQR